MYDHDCGYRKGREASRAERHAKRAAWRARWAARRAGRGDWSHFKDPKFWGLDAESMKGWGMGFGDAPDGSSASNSSSDVEALKAKVSDMERTIDAMNQRIIVLEKLIVDDSAIIAREIEKLRDKTDGDK